MKTLYVELGARRYPIHIGADLLGRAELLSPNIRARQVMVVSNETVAPLYLDRCLSGLSRFQCESVILPDGEQYKRLEVLNQIFDALLKNRFDRQATVVALGGGVIGDMAGFAAACYQRGVPFIQLPTTLLAQVDSSVGGKTAVNHAMGKNMIGAFYQPQCVIADTQTLNTLDDRQLRAGIAEVLKYGLIGDSEFFQWLEAHGAELMARDSDALAYAIERSCQSKADVVAADEREGGVRALLNLGHTFGHAIEAGAGYGCYLHGEAVAVGMCMAAHLSARMGWLESQDESRIERMIDGLGLPVRPPAGLTAQRMLELMAVDKKVLQGRIRLVLLKGIGRAVISDDYDEAALHATLHHFCV
ncbi:MAG: 3-dehydroquinate synthase [Gammaproteobacteria bacterium]|nr:3-dehydroquinate synthase [Gammaproteobacteria bacterium]